MVSGQNKNISAPFLEYFSNIFGNLTLTVQIFFRVFLYILEDISLTLAILESPASSMWTWWVGRTSISVMFSKVFFWCLREYFSKKIENISLTLAILGSPASSRWTWWVGRKRSICHRREHESITLWLWLFIFVKTNQDCCICQKKWKYYNLAMIISISNNKSKWSGHYCSCQTNHNDHNQQWKYYTMAVIICQWLFLNVKEMKIWSPSNNLSWWAWAQTSKIPKEKRLCTPHPT